MKTSEVRDEDKARIVELIVSGKTEHALVELSGAHDIPSPTVKVGKVKGHSKVAAVYVQKRRTIYASNSETFRNPLVMLHEFYHHLRAMSPRKAGTEKYADQFAEEFVRAYIRSRRA